MCRIGINLTNTTPNGTTIVSALGQYRKVGTASWINFNMILTNPQTPDITIIGDYELRVNVNNNLNDTSNWSNIVTFSVKSDCTSSGNGQSITGVCEAYDVRLDDIQSNGGTVNYVDCSGITQTMTVTGQLSTGVINFCSIGAPIPQGGLIIGGPYSECVDGNVPGSAIVCYLYELYAYGGYGSVEYTECLTGNVTNIYLDGSNSFGVDTVERQFVCSSTTPTLLGGQGNPITITRRQICNGEF